MTDQLALTRDAEPSLPDGIDLRCGSCADVAWPAADLVVADPPWSYTRAFRPVDASTTGLPDDHYACLSTTEIAHTLAAMPGRRLALWLTWPLLGEWVHASAGWSWGSPVSGGAWTKSGAGDRGHFGPGHHWAGCSEPVLVYARKGATVDKGHPLRNAWVERPSKHSRKPPAWMVGWVRRWVPAGGLVCDPFAGLGTVAEAVILAGEGRRYLGTEIDPARHAEAVGALATVRPDRPMPRLGRWR